MQRYDSYKDSGIQWLGEIPSHWEVKRIASLGFFSKGGGFSRNDLVEEDGLPAILYGDIYTKYNIEASKIISKVKYEVEKYSVLAHKGDLLMTGSGETKEDIGKTIVLKTDSYIGGDVIRFSQKGHDSKFLSYFLNSQYAKAYRFREAKGEIIVHIYASALKNMYISLPPFPEQQAIASYLDTATAKIDEAIAQQQKMIDLLNERKQIIINNAVTKGLNQNAKMKPSGIDWIGNIPKHWEVNRLKALTTNMRNGYVGPTRNLYQDAGVPYIQSLHVKNGTIDFNKKEYYVSPQWANKHPKIYKDDLVIVQTGDIGNTAIITEEFNGCNCHALIIVKVNKEIVIPEYLCFYLRSKVGKELMLQTKTGALLPHLNTTEIGTTIVIVPTIEEQRDIVNYLKEEMQKVESLIKIFEKQITLLQERKQIIINDVVTGKVKVC